VAVTMKNIGTSTWTTGDNFRLGSQNPQDNGIWRPGRVELAQPVAPGQSTTFNFPIRAPNTPGVYNFQWQMVHEGVGWFGQMSDNVAIQVIAQVDNAEFVRQSVYQNLTTGQEWLAWVTMKNSGTSTW